MLRLTVIGLRLPGGVYLGFVPNGIIFLADNYNR